MSTDVVTKLYGKFVECFKEFEPELQDQLRKRFGHNEKAITVDTGATPLKVERTPFTLDAFKALLMFHVDVEHQSLEQWMEEKEVPTGELFANVVKLTGSMDAYNENNKPEHGGQKIPPPKFKYKQWQMLEHYKGKVYVIISTPADRPLRLESTGEYAYSYCELGVPASYDNPLWVRGISEVEDLQKFKPINE